MAPTMPSLMIAVARVHDGVPSSIPVCGTGTGTLLEPTTSLGTAVGPALDPATTPVPGGSASNHVPLIGSGAALPPVHSPAGSSLIHVSGSSTAPALMPSAVP
jgi:hypothetical protein